MVEKLDVIADTLINYSLRIGPGDFLVVESDISACSLTDLLINKAHAKGAEGVIFELSPQSFQDMLISFDPDTGNSEFRQWKALIEKATAYVRMRADATWYTPTISLRESLEEEFNVLFSQWKTAINKVLAPARDAGLKWLVTAYPTQELVNDMGISLKQLEKLYVSALTFDYQQMSTEMEEIANLFQNASDVRIYIPESDRYGGTDLSFSLEGKEHDYWDGHNNMPDGEVEWSPVKESVNGHFRPTSGAWIDGYFVKDIYLRFVNGEIVDYDAADDRGRAILKNLIETDEGSKYLGEFAIGTNWGIDCLTGFMLFDEKIGGTFHLAVGKSYDGKNVSSRHEDFIGDLRDNGGWIEANGKKLTVSDQGKYVISKNN